MVKIGIAKKIKTLLPGLLLWAVLLARLLMGQTVWQRGITTNTGAALGVPLGLPSLIGYEMESRDFYAPLLIFTRNPWIFTGMKERSGVP